MIRRGELGWVGKGGPWDFAGECEKYCKPACEGTRLHRKGTPLLYTNPPTKPLDRGGALARGCLRIS